MTRTLRPLAAATSIITWTTTRNATSDCEDVRKQANTLQKQTTLRQAVSEIQRFSTKHELSQLRGPQEAEMLQRWERDEDGWRELPARAWPAYQPNPEQLVGLQAEVTHHKCTSENNKTTDSCKELLFQVATALVFYNLDAEAGVRQYEQLAEDGHVDSMVACGVVLVEGMGVPPQEDKGIEWLKKAVAFDSAQGCYELATVLYTGLEGVVEEDAKAAFELFKKAAKQDHTAALYMMADCLVEGEGTEISVAQAVPLFYRAAERGHRYARQRIRELLAKLEYQS
jgi:TPR repeat protein